MEGFLCSGVSYIRYGRFMDGVVMECGLALLWCVHGKGSRRLLV